jgi:hypothetical protein
LTEKLDTGRTNVSKQICELYCSGIVEMNSIGRHNYYSMSSALKKEHIELLKNIIYTYDKTDLCTEEKKGMKEMCNEKN